ncbi:MAG: hypothetical protein Q8M58_05760 [Anaerolineales bacterium]|nr:hypothetical protein [Anaerolineales bacterium]
MIFQIIAFIHAAGQRAHRRAALRQRGLDLLEHILADVADRPFQVEAKHHVEIGRRVGVNGEDAARLILRQIFDNHSGDGGFTHTTFACECDGDCHEFIFSGKSLDDAQWRVSR